MTDPKTKWILIYNAYSESDRVQRFYTKEELELYMNSNNIGQDPEVYEVKAYDVKHTAVLAQSNESHESTEDKP